MEKQLELKEASTRRKILALKQQLIGNQNPVLNPKLVQTNTFTRAHFRSTNPLTDQPEMRHPPHTAPPQNVTHATRDEDITKSKSDRLVTSVNGGLKSMQQDDYNHTSTHKVFSGKTDSVILQSQPLTSTSINRQTLHLEQPKSSLHLSSKIVLNEPYPANVGNPQRSTPVGSSIKISDFEPAQIKRTQHDSVSPMQRVDSSSLTVPKDDVKKTVSIIPSEASSKQSSKPATISKSTPVKLSLPEEIKETEYMTALQRQKARVSRIRRCIIAATVIQRAWRYHKQLL